MVERAGNKVPHPAVLFLVLIVLVVALSHVLFLLGASVSYQRINPETHEAEQATTAVNSLLSADGIRFIFTSVVPNFINFGPVGIILVAMIGIGLAERSGLIQALIRKIVLVAPRGSDHRHRRHARRAVEHRLRRRLPGVDSAGRGGLSQPAAGIRWPVWPRRSPAWRRPSARIFSSSRSTASSPR